VIITNKEKKAAINPWRSMITCAVVQRERQYFQRGKRDRGRFVDVTGEMSRVRCERRGRTEVGNLSRKSTRCGKKYPKDGRPKMFKPSNVSSNFVGKGSRGSSGRRSSETSRRWQVVNVVRATEEGG